MRYVTTTAIVFDVDGKPKAFEGGASIVGVSPDQIESAVKSGYAVADDTARAAAKPKPDKKRGDN